jgi:hypothetical protein
MKKAFLSILMLIVAVCGCRSAWPFSSVETPAWVQSPATSDESGQFLSAAGMGGPEPSPQAAEAEADRDARAKLAAAVSDYTGNVLAAFLKAHAEYPPPSSPASQEFSTVLTAEVAAAVLRQSTMEKSWMAPDGEAHVLYRAPIAAVNEQIAQRMRYSLRHVNPFGSSADQALGQMQSFLETKLQERLTAAARARAATPETPRAHAIPAWVQAARHDSYPPDKFFSAMATGADQASAETSARKQLTVSLEADLGRRLERLQRSQADSPLGKNLPWLDPRTIAFTEQDLTAVRVAEQWHDSVTQTFYTLVVLDRSAAALACRTRITMAQEVSGSLLASARNHQKAENYAASLRDYLDAQAAACRAVKAQLRGVVLAPEGGAKEFEDMVTTPILAEVGGDLRSLLQGISIVKIAGDRQWMPPGVPPKSPFKVRVTAGTGSKPLAGVPVRLHLNSASVLATTDDSGTAQWQLQEPLPEGSRPAVAAELDLGTVSPEASPFRLTAPSVTFEYVLRSRANSHLVVYVREKTATGKIIETPLAEALKQALAAEGFRVVPDSDVLKYSKASDLNPDLPDAQALDAFSTLADDIGPRRFLLLAIGQMQVRLERKAKTPEGDIYIVNCPFKIRVLDNALPGEQKVVLTVSGTGKGAYLNDEAEATRRARADAAAEASAQLVNALRQKLGP